MCLEDVNFHETLLIAEGEVITIQLIVIPEDNGRGSFEIHSLANAENNGRGIWTFHVTGKMAVDNRAAPSERVSPQEILARCQNMLAIEPYYQMLAEFGVAYGPSFRRIESFQRRVTNPSDELDFQRPKQKATAFIPRCWTRACRFSARS